MTETDSTTALLEEVCRVLGEGWTFEEDDIGDRHHLRGPEYVLFARCEKGRFCFMLSVSSELMRHASYIDWPEINVSSTRSALAMAGDVRRRLLPVASEVYRKLVERQAKAVEFEREQWLILDTVADVLGVEHLDRERGFAQSVHWSSGATSRPYTSVWVTADGDNEVTLKLSGVSLETAYVICRLLTGRKD